jgi:hypothetical protein
MNAEESPQGKVIYRKATSEGQEIVVTQGPQIPVAHLAPFFSGNPEDDCFWLDVELRARGTRPVRLWSKLWWLSRDLQYDDFKVFDLLVVDRQVILATGATSTIDVVSIELPKPARVTYLVYADWGTLMVPSLIPHPGVKLDARLSYAIPQGRVQVEVIQQVHVMQSVKGVAQHTVFEQQKPDWEFARVKQWQEDIPATPKTKP